MKNKTHLIVCAIIFGLGQILMFTYCVFDQRATNKTIRATQETYYSLEEYILEGQITNKELVHDLGSKYRDIYLLSINVDTFIINRYERKSENPYIGIYNDSTKTAYVVSSLYTYEDNGMLPSIQISTENKLITFSTGETAGLMMGDWDEVFHEKESTHTIRF